MIFCRNCTRLRVYNKVSVFHLPSCPLVDDGVGDWDDMSSGISDVWTISASSVKLFTVKIYSSHWVRILSGTISPVTDDDVNDCVDRSSGFSDVWTISVVDETVCHNDSR